MIAFVSVAPEDHWEHMSALVADAVQIVKDSGLNYELGPMGTAIEGEPEDVFPLIQAMHMAVRKKSKRVSTLVKIDDQVDRPQGRLKAKVETVQQALAFKKS